MEPARQPGMATRNDERTPLSAALASAQGAYYAATGVWPMLHMRSFLAVTGPKTDLWLVHTVGALVTTIGGVLANAGRRGRVTDDLRLLAVGSAAALTAIEVVYVARGRISPVYLLDAAAEVGLIAAWGLTLRERHAV